jgi:hypothetical protein
MANPITSLYSNDGARSHPPSASFNKSENRFKNADHSIMRPAVKNCVSNRVVGRVRLNVPQPTEWQRIGNQIDAAFATTSGLALALFYCKKLGHEFVEDPHRDQIGNCPIFEALRNDGRANLRPRIGESKPDGLADRLGG